MGLEEKHIDQIDAYLQGQLKGDELSSFLKEVAENEELRRELDIQKAIQEGIEHKNNQDVRNRLNQISAEFDSPEKEAKVVSVGWGRIVSSIAAVLLLCFAAYFLFDRTSDTGAIYAKHFHPSELTITRSTDVDAELVILKELYNTQNYENALPLFEQVINADPSASNLRLAYGNALMKCMKMDLASAQFEYIITIKDPLYIDQARWYLALVELNEGNLVDCRALLQRLGGDTESDYHSEALRLLDELKNVE
ncbi:MAG: hypothetical protein AAGA77_23150 [Bacteroidota bacterium]